MATIQVPINTSQSEHRPYKYQWARFVARENLQADFTVLNEKLSQVNNLPLAGSISELIQREIEQERDVIPGDRPAKDGKFKVGIVGAGAAGLFTAMIIDHLNAKIDGLKISYDILEAGDDDRLGGRLYTHRFSKAKHDYYDVGAMRFPMNDIMHRTFQLFKLTGIDKKLVPYYFGDEDKVCPSYFNDILHRGPPSGKDPFKFNEGLPKAERIPDHLIEENPGIVADRAIKGLTDAFENQMSQHKGWEQLMRADFMSTRQYFRETKIKDLPDGPGYNFNTTEWLETFNLGTGWYNQSLAETVLDTLDFKADEFRCIEGGTQQLATAMAAMVKQQPEFNMEVTGINAEKWKSGITKLNIKKKNLKDPKKSTYETRDYFAVFNSTTLGALQRMDLTKAGLRYGTKQAIRSLGYGASCKVGMKFKTGWWMKEPHNIKKGGLGKTDLPLRVCVYPSYNLEDSDGECVLLCSYTWAQDAQRMGSLISPKSPAEEDELLDTLFHNLALLHETPSTPYAELHAFIKEQYITHHAFDWYCDQNMSGAFAYFGPGQFSGMWPEIIRPNGWLFLIGEAASAHHAWIVGALESSVRAVYQMLDMLYIQNPDYAPYKTAMERLSNPPPEDKDLPFSPLPEEMPLRLPESDGKAPQTDVPTKGQEVTFTTAQVILSFFDQIVEMANAEAARKEAEAGKVPTPAVAV